MAFLFGKCLNLAMPDQAQYRSIDFNAIGFGVPALTVSPAGMSLNCMRPALDETGWKHHRHLSRPLAPPFRLKQSHCDRKPDTSNNRYGPSNKHWYVQKPKLGAPGKRVFHCAEIRPAKIGRFKALDRTNRENVKKWSSDHRAEHDANVPRLHWPKNSRDGYTGKHSNETKELRQSLVTGELSIHVFPTFVGQSLLGIFIDRGEPSN